MALELYKTLDTTNLEEKLRQPGISLTEHDEAIAALSEKIYEMHRNDLEANYLGKRAAIVFAHHCEDNQARIYVTDANIPVIKLAEMIQEEHDVAIPSLVYVGNPDNDPQIEDLVTPLG
jgi:hypothetical protein